jgi:hypothetical protein
MSREEEGALRRNYCRACGGELRGKTVHEGRWSYHLKCWRRVAEHGGK